MKSFTCPGRAQLLSVDIAFGLDYYTHSAFIELISNRHYGNPAMIEKTLIVIIAVVFLASSWWWSNLQDATENFYEEQLRVCEAVITQLGTLALPQVQGKTPEKVQALFRNLYPQQDVRYDDGIVFSGALGVRFSEDAAAGFVLPWDETQEASSQ